MHFIAGFEEVSNHVGKAPMARDWGWLQSNSRQECEALILTTYRKLSAANNHMNLESDLISVELTDENPSMVSTLIMAFWDWETDDSVNLCPDSWPTEAVR